MAAKLFEPTTDAYPEVYFSRLLITSDLTFATVLKQDNGMRDTGLSSIRSRRAAPNARPQSSKISYVKGGLAH